jgi:hypothetical protein
VESDGSAGGLTGVWFLAHMWLAAATDRIGRGFLQERQGEYYIEPPHSFVSDFRFPTSEHEEK